jgi:hypothetical protein
VGTQEEGIKMIKALLNLLDRIGRKRIIMDRADNEPYLERYYVFLKDRKHFPFNIFIHKFLKSDPDDVHDHPWPYATLILRGGYYEWIPEFNSKGEKISETRHWRVAGHFRICGANSYHRIELDPNVTAWTMFMPGPQRREWGFLVNNKWIPNGQYLQHKADQYRSELSNNNT